ncbi:envelope protein p74 [Lymantria dispar multiple nucleopolyhedrovirus]|uniref:Envelope protein p74 n=1 Tax=Lymantria dispar multicapsid nuclear polyhedrosis virus TaxID=10449 RepID=Q9YMU7_NPVLD|nr:envelope protein p74 [Lymantria dispar multiple nucleopolyhedrovirus]AAC70212.1 envelope protein p74 [Lymantria dispar multiple nucleopolyhedrovirus]
MAALTSVDLMNASKYASHMHRLAFIPRWRSKMPHVLIDYEIRPATNDDFYVPPNLADRAVATKVAFSRRGCESMSCYPFTETGTVDASTATGYTQTSETAVEYAQPACYHLDRAAATREGAENEVQAPELRYTDGGKCIIVDTLSKMYFNTPYLRTDEHTVQGVDDVPAFNVTPETGAFPEMFRGEFNEAYCRRFGRSLINGGCSMQWWESLIGFVLGDTIYVTFKLLANNVFSELRNYDYARPSPLLPDKPSVDGASVLARWRSVRDPRADFDFERSFLEFRTLADLRIDARTKLVYTAESGFATVGVARDLKFRRATAPPPAAFSAAAEAELDAIISQFLEDHSLVLGILTDLAFDALLDQFKALLKKMSTQLIPALKRALLSTSKRVTSKMLGETFKAAMVHQFNRIAIKTVSTVAKAMTKIGIKAASVVGIVLIVITIADLVLALWDPFGYNNMFPRSFPEDMSRSFLAGYFQSMGETRDMIEMLPEYFDDLIEEDDSAVFESLLHILDYVSELEVNSNGQLLQLNEGEPIEDFDELTVLGSALASSAMYTKLDFLKYTARHTAALEPAAAPGGLYLACLWALAGLVAYVIAASPTRPRPAGASTTLASLSIRAEEDLTRRHASVLFVIFLLILLYTVMVESVSYYLRLHREAARVTASPLWYQNLDT